MAIINLVLSIILCKFIGMTGVILGMAMFMLQIIELISEGKTEKYLILKMKLKMEH